MPGASSKDPKKQSRDATLAFVFTLLQGFISLFLSCVYDSPKPTCEFNPNKFVLRSSGIFKTFWRSLTMCPHEWINAFPLGLSLLSPKSGPTFSLLHVLPGHAFMCSYHVTSSMVSTCSYDVMPSSANVAAQSWLPCFQNHERNMLCFLNYLVSGIPLKPLKKK